MLNWEMLDSDRLGAYSWDEVSLSMSLSLLSSLTYVS